MKRILALFFLLSIFQLGYTQGLRHKYPHDGLFTDIQFSNRTDYLSYTGLLRLGLHESSRIHSWVDRKDIDRYLYLEERIKQERDW